MVTSTRILAGVGLAVVAIAAGCGMTDADKVVQASDGALTVEDQETQARTSHPIAFDTEIFKDGEPAKLEDLQPGDEVQVRAQEENGESVATFVKAESPDADEATDDADDTITDEGGEFEFAEDRDPGILEESPAELEADVPATDFVGKVLMVEEHEMMLEASGGEQHKFTFNEQTEFTRDGEKVAFDAIQAGDTATVTARDDTTDPSAGELIAMTVNATSPPEPTEDTPEGEFVPQPQP
jgi:hypothetical protein